MDRTAFNRVATQIVDSCFHVHNELGPGLLESAYEYALLKEFELRHITARNQVPIKLFYKGHDTGKHYVIDLLVEDEVIIELKCADCILPVHTAQIISYLKLSRKKLGFLINFHVPAIKDGIKRFVNNF